jgi:protocatechuate 3,4-dioxygenase beta subunit
MTRTDPDDRHDLGLTYDLGTLWDRRRVLGLFAAAGAATLVGCAAEEPSRTDGGATRSAGASADDCAVVPEETAGPYPGDGSNGPNVLTESGIVRSDITSSFGSANGTAEGVALTIELTVLDATDGCVPRKGCAVYLWHCDRDGRYSLYSEGATDQNYLRGVQEADSAGTVRFTSTFPAAYSGRWPHIHFEVYQSLDEATAAGQIAATSQIALPEEVCNAVYATSGYEQSAQNMSATTLEQDMVFSDDGGERQLATVTGGVDEGYVAALTIAV